MRQCMKSALCDAGAQSRLRKLWLVLHGDLPLPRGTAGTTGLSSFFLLDSFPADLSNVKPLGKLKVHSSSL